MMLISEQQVLAENIVVLGISGRWKVCSILLTLQVMQGYIEKSDLSNPDKYKALLAELK